MQPMCVYFGKSICGNLLAHTEILLQKQYPKYIRILRHCFQVPKQTQKFIAVDRNNFTPKYNSVSIRVSTPPHNALKVSTLGITQRANNFSHKSNHSMRASL